ncbi:hypothetical protein [Burkholderia glumae]|uniref:hypothetical protein n=1 Tax=Burkholderia glumae TaxID=337 RepID=UPI00039C152E|nr:hypothetical protein [Burkholderia glumae]MCM2494567.1 hypothetical protein [Burkholderia glumae]
MAGRKTAPKIVNVTPEPLAPTQQGSVEAANVLAAVQADYNDERDLVNQMLGQAQMADAFAKFSVTVTTSKLAFVKENKLYRALGGKKSGDGHQFSGTWEEFCSLLGRSREQVDEDIRNLKSLGELALESMSRMGIGYRELRQFRRLPDDQKAALIEVAKAGDKDSFLELAEDLITKHTKEKEALTQRVEEAEADLEARARVLDDKNTKIDHLSSEMAKLKKRVKRVPPDEEGAEIRKEASAIAFDAEVILRGNLCSAFETLAQHTEAHGIPHDDFMAGLLCQLELALNQLRGKFDVKSRPDGDDTPEWMRPGAEEAVTAIVAADMAAAGWTRDSEGHMVPADTTDVDA